jgi:hypothetical protein
VEAGDSLRVRCLGSRDRLSLQRIYSSRFAISYYLILCRKGDQGISAHMAMMVVFQIR